jgi:ATP-dependent DNA helicase RecQ
LNFLILNLLINCIMLKTALKTHFGYESFRPGQDEIIKSILDHKDTLALMPTGGGKSLCFQLPALLLDGVSLIISPLIALMKDQVDALRAKGISAAFLNSTLSAEELGSRLAEVRQGKFKMVYLAPERLASSNFLNEAVKWPISIIAVDEAHCVSQWGHDFRPDYLLIKKFILSLKKRPIVTAFTATATPEVKRDIEDNLGLENANIFIRGFDRPNLIFYARAGLRHNERFKETARILKSTPGSAIVYVGKRDTAEELADFLKSRGISAFPYHAGMKAEERSSAQEDFMNDRVRVIVATIAFGMGVDKPDVRLVIHAHTPSSLENYYQEAGRAGRDGEKASCILLHSFQDALLHRFFIQKSREDMSQNGLTAENIEQQCKIKEERLKIIERYVLGRSCRRKKILEYFSDPSAKKLFNCQTCDICLNHKWEKTEEPPIEKRHYGYGEYYEEYNETTVLFEKLKSLRLALARQMNVRAYMIFSDRVLHQFAKQKPVNEMEMLEINGVGANLFHLYGNYFLEEICKYKNSQGTGTEYFQKIKRERFHKDKPERGDSNRKTRELFLQGKDVNVIAKERNLKETTVLQHLCEEHRCGRLTDISALLPVDIANEIRQVIETFNGHPVRLREIKDKCSERVQYHHIRLVMNSA